MSEFTGGTTPTYFNPQSKREPSELEIWLADGPDMDEIIARFAQLETELEAFKTDLTYIGLRDVNRQLSTELAIRRQWNEEISTLNLGWAKKLSAFKWKQAHTLEEDE